MNLAYTLVDLRRVLRDRARIFFSTALPAFFYVVFGATQGYSDAPAGHGDVAMVVMVSMAAYGAVTATVAIGAGAALERFQGWGRQLALTPMRPSAYLLTKAAVAAAVALLPVGLVYGLGRATGAEGTVRAWVLSALVVAAGSMAFVLYGMVFALALRGDAAISAAAGSLVVLAFLGDVFTPLSGTLLTISRFTPLYGYVALARWPVTEGLRASSEGLTGPEPLWVPVANLLGWTLALALVALWLLRRRSTR